MNQFMFDVETLGVESSAVVLSMACIAFDFDEYSKYGNDPYEYYQVLLERALFVKFQVKEQFRSGRTSDKGTMEFWADQDPEARKKSFNPDATRDVEAALGLKKLFWYTATEMGVDSESSIVTIPQGYTFWQRGGLDQIMLDSLCITSGVNKFINFWDWMDVRTMLAITKDTVVRGYATVPGFDFRNKVVKHDPVHDCAYDILMMVAGK